LKLTLRQQLTQFSTTLQSKLFPILKDELGELSSAAKRLVATLARLSHLEGIFVRRARKFLLLSTSALRKSAKTG